MGIVDLLRQIPDIHFTENEIAADKTSLKVGGTVRYFALPESVYGASRCFAAARETGVTVKVIGNGTNLLVSDHGFDGLILCTKNLNRVFLDKGEVIALCGTPLNRVVNFVASCGRRGAEGLIGIPATVGGAIFQNAGAFNYTVSDYLTEVTVLSDGETQRLKKAECGFGYRTSAFKSAGEKKGDFIVSAKFSFPKRRVSVKARDEREEFYLSARKNAQPVGRTCGSVFKNPPNAFAGALIERAGLKGERVGGARVSDKHANFIITEDGACARDVYNLILKIKRIVYEKFGVTLIEEVEYIGEF